MWVSVTLIPSLRQNDHAHLTNSHAVLMELAMQIAEDAQDMPITILGEDGRIAASFGPHDTLRASGEEVELF